MSANALDCSAQVIEHKKGDTFEVQATYSDNENNPINLEGYLITSQIRHPNGTLVANVEISLTDQSQSENVGNYGMRVGNTSSWPVADLVWDIRYSFDDTLISTETVVVRILNNVTR